MQNRGSGLAVRSSVDVCMSDYEFGMRYGGAICP